MASKDREEQSGFVVNDRRLFSSDGELRQDVVKAEEAAAEQERVASAVQQRANEEREAQQKAAQASETQVESPSDIELPEAPSAAEHQASADAYAASTKQVDERIHKELSKQGRADQARDLEMSFDKFIASLYMTTLMQLGLAAPQGEKPMLISWAPVRPSTSSLSCKTKPRATSVPAEEGICSMCSTNCAWPISK